jgi:transposase-like protein
MMAVVLGRCPQCHGIYVVKYGKQANGTQRYRCNDPDCTRRIFLLQYHQTGRLPEIEQRIVDLRRNGYGVRDIVRVLEVSSATVIHTLKKATGLQQVNRPMLQTLASKHAREREPVGIKAELDERWGCVGDKETARW